MHKVFLDTSFILIPFEFSVDIFEELRYVVPGKYTLHILSSTLNELERLALKKKKVKRWLPIIKQMLKQYTIHLEEVEGNYTDQHILNKSERIIVATQDMGLKNKLREKRIPVIYLKKKEYLVIEDEGI